MSPPVRSSAVRIVEVGPRDGLQNVKATVPTATKLELIRRLRNTGLQTIEITSVVSPKAIPQLSDCLTVLSSPNVQTLFSNQTVNAPVLIPNLKGLDIALKHNVREVAVFVSASEGFSKANINCSVQQGLDRAKAVAEKARTHGVAVRGYISCIFSCPYDGPTAPASVLNCVQQLLSMGCYEISLGDTLGVGVAAQVQGLLAVLTNAGVSIDRLAGHFHDTYGQAVANIWAAYQYGVRVFDSSVSGLGGCPYAPGAKGNVATEDVVYLFEQAGIETKVNLPELVNTGVWISEQLSKQNESRAGSALAAKKNANPIRENPVKKAARGISWLKQASPDGLQILRSGTNVKVVMDRPKNGNALTTSMISSLTELLENAASDSSITRFIITARGKYFCTGMDLSQDGTPVSEGQSASDAQFVRLTRLLQAIDNAPQVTIACVQGPAFGGGVGVAFACDIRLMTKNASMTLSEVKLGLCPATISRYVIREWGAAFTREAMLSGRTILPSELASLGKVRLVVENESDLIQKTDEYVTNLKTSAPNASTLCKELVRLSWKDGGGGTKQGDGIRSLFDEMMGGPEAAYGLKQFQQRNKKVDWDARGLEKGVSKAKL